MTNLVSRSVCVTLQSGKSIELLGEVSRELDRALRKAAGGSLSAREAQDLVHRIFRDRELQAEENLPAIALAALTRFGAEVQKVTYGGQLANKPFETALRVRANTAQTLGASLGEGLDKLDDRNAPALGVLQRMIGGVMPRPKTATTALQIGYDRDLARSLRDMLVGAESSNSGWGGFVSSLQSGGPIPNDTARKMMERLRSAPAIGTETMHLLTSMLRHSKFEDLTEWYSLRGALQERYATDLKTHYPPERIATEVLRLADRFADSRKKIDLQEGAKLLALGTMEGIPSAAVRRTFQTILKRFPFTVAARKALETYLGNLPAVKPKEWTMFVYLAGDNNLEDFGLADIREMESKFGRVAEFMNIVVLVDGAKNQSVGDSGAYNWTSKSRLLLIEQNGSADTRSVKSKEIPIPNNTELGALMRAGRGELNMASGKTLTAALKFLEQYVPSDKLFVDIWNHGASWRGVAGDDAANYHGDLLRMEELAQAIGSVDREIDVMGFDACLMQNLGVASMLEKAGVKHAVASEEIEPGAGWPYDALLERMARSRAATGTLSAEQLATNVVEAYDSLTLSALDTSAMIAIRAQLNNLGKALMRVGGLADSRVDEARNNTYTYEDYESGDLVHFCKNLREQFGNDSAVGREARKMERLVKTSVVANNAKLETPGAGLMVYLPFGGDFDPTFKRHNPATVKDAPHWVEFLQTQAVA